MYELPSQKSINWISTFSTNLLTLFCETMLFIPKDMQPIIAHDLQQTND